jgi:hypothetical protein
VLPGLRTTGVTIFRNPIPGAEQSPIASGNPNVPHGTLLVIEHLQIPDWLARTGVCGKPVIYAVKTDLIAAGLFFCGSKSSVGI